METIEARKKRKITYLKAMSKRFMEARRQFVKDNGFKALQDVDEFFGFPDKYINGFLYKKDSNRSVPSWVFPHMYLVNRVEAKKNPEYVPFDLEYVAFGYKTSKEEEKKPAKKKRTRTKDLLIYQTR